jgi:thiol-disulfide isomerase/thioredoxin
MRENAAAVICKNLAWLMVFAAGVFGTSVSAAAQGSTPAPAHGQRSANSQVNKDAEAEAELEKALGDAGNDSAAMVRNLTNYLQKYPDAPRKAGIYRALVEACQQVQNSACAVDYAERAIAIRPEDSDMMLLAANLLEQRGDDASLTRAAGYVTRVLDRAEKAAPEEKPARESLAEWREGQDQLRATLYYARGRIEKSQSSNDAAAKDLSQSYAVLPNALAAKGLGEIAELRRDAAGATEEYLLAFVLPEESPVGRADRREVRLQLGNVWRQAHGSDAGLGEAILAAFDRVSAPTVDAQAGPASLNKGAKDAFAFVLRRPDGAAVPLAPLKGKIVALSFWATWCGPCRELEPEFNRVADAYAKNPDVVFLAVNVDDDETQVLPYLKHQKWDVPVMYADGLEDFLKVDSLPTVVLLGRSGEIAYRINGLPPEGVDESLTLAIQAALGAPAR